MSYICCSRPLLSKATVTKPKVRLPLAFELRRSQLSNPPLSGSPHRWVLCGRNFQKPERRTGVACLFCWRGEGKGSGVVDYPWASLPSPARLNNEISLLCHSHFSVLCCLPWLARWDLWPIICSLSSASTIRGCGFHTRFLKTESISNGKWEVSNISLVKTNGAGGGIL